MDFFLEEDFVGILWAGEDVRKGIRWGWKESMKGDGRN